MLTSTDKRWLRLAQLVGSYSKCSRRKIGAIILGADGRLTATGYNGAPRGFPDMGKTSCTQFCPAAMSGQRASENDYANCVAVHAEINAMLHANRADMAGGTIYVPYSLCMSCAKAIANSGISRVVWVPAENKKEENKMVLKLFDDCGLDIAIGGEDVLISNDDLLS